ncbi:MAG TPA: MFS transporter [Myxococcales bacterium]|nr:MFS transporter [Myxococcales bacterium]
MLHRPSERTVIFLIGAVQFVNILDFMMVLPLGPFFAGPLGIPASRIGVIGGSYTAAAAVSGIACSFFLDRFDRRKALGVAVAGLVVATALGGFSTGFVSMVFARILAGMFGGPATSLSLSIVADVVPADRRGKALGAVMGSFSVAAVLGVPTGLELARWGGWRVPFFSVAGLGLVLIPVAIALLPPLTGHLAARKAAGPRTGFISLLGRRTVQLSAVATVAVMGSAFLVVPVISPYLVFNLHFPTKDLKWIYMIGGAISFVALRIIGVLVDRYGSTRLAVVGTAIFLIVSWLAFVRYDPRIPITLLFVLFMTGMNFRMAPYQTLISKVPAPQERASFMSLMSAIQHLSTSAGAVFSSVVLSTGEDGALVGMPRLGLIAMALSTLVPPLFWLVERRVEHGAQVAPAAVAVEV